MAAPRPPPASRLPQPFNILEELDLGNGTATTSLGCACGHVTQLRVGFVATPAAGTFVSTVSFNCRWGGSDATLWRMLSCHAAPVRG